MTRLAKYAADVPEVRYAEACGLCRVSVWLTLLSLQVVPQFQSADAFGKFSAAISKVVAVQTEMAVVDIVSMYSSLVTFALQVCWNFRRSQVTRLRSFDTLSRRCTVSNWLS